MKLVFSTLLIAVVMSAVQTQYVSGSKFATETPRLSLVSRISFRVQPDLEKESSATKIEYVNTKFFDSSNFPNELITFHAEDPATTGNTVSTLKTEVIKNDALASAFTSLVYRYTPTESMESVDGAILAIKGEAYDGTTAALSGDPVEFNAMYVVKTDWKQIMYVIFSIAKIFMNIVIVYITFARPFMPEWSRLRAIWVGQTVIYYQLLVYSGLIPGVFGYTIDMGQEGMIKSSRRYAFINTIPKIDDEQDFVVYKFIQNDFIPKVIEECLIEVLSMAFITIAVLILKVLSRGARDNKLLRIAREIKSSVYVFSFIPFIVHFTHQLLSVAYSKDQKFYSILAIIAGISLIAIYLNHFFRMAQGIRDINFLHSKAVYQEGKVRIEQGLDWAFDTYISMDTNVPIRIAELFIYMIFAANYASGYVIGAFSATFCFIMYVVLLLGNIQKFSKYITGTRERDIQKKITLFSIIHLSCITFNHLIYLFFWLFKGMSLKATKFWTFVWYLITFIDLIVIFVQLGFRLYTMNLIPEYINKQEEEDMRVAQIAEYKESQRTLKEDSYKPVKQPAQEPEDNGAPVNRRTVMNNNDGDSEQFNPNQNAGMQNKNPYVDRKPLNQQPNNATYSRPEEIPVVPKQQQVYVDDPANFYEESLEDVE